MADTTEEQKDDIVALACSELEVHGKTVIEWNERLGKYELIVVDLLKVHESTTYTNRWLLAWNGGSMTVHSLGGQHAVYVAEKMRLGMGDAEIIAAMVQRLAEYAQFPDA